MFLKTVARQAPLSVEFPRQEYRSGLPLVSPGNLPGTKVETELPGTLMLGKEASKFFTTEPPGKPPNPNSLQFYEGRDR